MFAGPSISYTAVIVGATPSFVVGNPTSRCGGGNLRSFIDIHPSGFGIVRQGYVVLYRSILVTGVQRTGDTAPANILRDYPTERQTSFQSPLHRPRKRLPAPLRSRLPLPNSSRKTLQAFRRTKSISRQRLLRERRQGIE